MTNAFRGLIAAAALSLCPGPAAAENGEIRVGESRVLTLKADAPGGLSPEDRALIANRRIELALEDPAIGPENIRWEAVSGGAAVLAGGSILIQVWPADAQADQSTANLLAEHWADLLRTQFKEAKLRRYSMRLLLRHLWGLIYPVFFLLGLLGVRRLARTGQALVHGINEEAPSPLRFGTFELVSMNAVKLGLRYAVSFSAAVLSLGIGYAFLLAVFLHFPFSRRLAEWISSAVFAATWSLGAALLGQLDWFLPVGVVFFGTYLVIGLLDRFFDHAARRQLPFPSYITADNLDTTENLAKGLVYLAAMLVVVSLLPGRGGSVATGALALFGLALALASVSTLRHLLAGLLLTFMPSRRRGSRLELDGRDATVMRRGLLMTGVLFEEGERRLVPNERILESPVLSDASGGVERWEAAVTLGPGADLKSLEAALGAWAAERGAGWRARLQSVEGERLRLALQVPRQPDTTNPLASLHEPLNELLKAQHARLAALSAATK